jgi:hypothetical protein
MRNFRTIRWLLLALLMLAIPAASHAQIAVGLSIRIAPPILPVYTQPICPEPGYIWTPGYWGYGSDGYYWVPGTWVMAPEVGFLWTPGYWGWAGGLYAWHGGYWGPHVGFYGGVNYGFGYGGVGFAGGYWNHDVFAYNRAYSNVNVSVIHNTYTKTVINNNTTINRTSYNGGAGGINARPTADEEAAAHEHHVDATSAQVQHEHAASTDRAMLASENHGRPSVAATSRPGEFSGNGVVGSRGAAPVHANDRPPTSGAGASPNHPVTADRTAGSGNDRPNTAATGNAANGGHPNNATPADRKVNTPPASSNHSNAKPQSKPAPKPKPSKPPKDNKKGEDHGRG